MMYKIDLSKIKPRKTSKPDNISSIATPVICNPCVWDRFDKIYCIHYLPYTERFECIKSELNRIGILNLPQFEFYYTINNPYYEEILKSDKVENGVVNRTNIKYTIDSLNCLIKCKELGYRNVLIIEDDLKFIEDVSVIEQHIKSIPSDYDFVNMDTMIYSLCKHNDVVYDTYNMLQNMRNANQKFWKFNILPIGLWLFQTSFIALSGRMIEHIIDSNIQKLKPFDWYCVNQNTNNENFNRYISTTRLGKQLDYSKAQDCVKKSIEYIVPNTTYQHRNKINTYVNFYAPYERLVFYSVYSMIRNNVQKIIILTSNLEYKYVLEKVSKFKTVFSITKDIIDVEIVDNVYDFYGMSWNDRIFDYTALYRLFIPLLPSFKTADYSMYIDVDTYINSQFNQDECVESISDPNFILAARKSIEDYDMIPRDRITIEDYCKYIRELDEKVYGRCSRIKDSNIINSGVLLFNNNRIDIQNYRDNLFFVLQKNKQIIDSNPKSYWFKYPDQDILNIMFNDIYTLDKRYNWKQWWYKEMVLEDNIDKLNLIILEDICNAQGISIMHFQGNQKGKIKPALNKVIDSDTGFTSGWKEISG